MNFKTSITWSRYFLTLLLFISVFTFGVGFALGNKQQAALPMLEKNMYTLEKKSLENLSEDYHEDKGYFVWKTKEDVAKQMVKNSKGKFKSSWAKSLVEQADKKDINPFLVYELIKVETGGTYNEKLVGPLTKYGRAYGLGQFMKNTAPWVADMANLPYEDQKLFDPKYSIKLTITYLDYLYSSFKNWDEALTAYHRGVSGMKTYKAINGDAKSWYAVQITNQAEIQIK
ncbi:transglycosylase SLT domain-containing protein [Bacillaceae bacterium S4-13-56]